MKKVSNSPALKKLSASCKAAARKKFKVYPSAYANGWAAKQYKKLMKKRGAKAPYWKEE